MKKLFYRGFEVLVKTLLLGTSALYYLSHLKRNQWKPLRELKEIQWKKLKNIVNYAYYNIPYYRMFFKSEHFKPDDLRSPDDLRKIPTTTKNNVHMNHSNMIAKGVEPSRYHISYTAGTTGIPVKVLLDQKNYCYSTAIVAYSSIECGLSLRDKLVVIGNSNTLRYSPKIITIPRPLESGDLDRTIRRLGKIKPDVIYISSWEIPTICNANISEIKPRIIFSHSGTLPQHTRALVRSKFGIEIHDTYGATELNRMAFECNEHSGMHMITDNSFIEFLDDGEPVSPGEMGEVVVTSLSNYAMPFIRYELGDLASTSSETCSCGRSWPIIKSVEGRIADIFTLESGRKIYPLFWFSYIMFKNLHKNIFCVSQFQIIQEKKNNILLKIVKGKEYNKIVMDKMKKSVEKGFLEIGEKVSLDIQIVNEIPKEPSGKKKLVKSLVK
jgi:phenylacetate-CoA ligase